LIPFLTLSSGPYFSLTVEAVFGCPPGPGKSNTDTPEFLVAAVAGIFAVRRAAPALHRGELSAFINRTHVPITFMPAARCDLAFSPAWHATSVGQAAG